MNLTDMLSALSAREAAVIITGSLGLLFMLISLIGIIRLPDFVTKADFEWALEEATRKKKTDFSKAEFLTYHEGLCVQCMHVGSYDDEPATVQLMHEYMRLPYVIHDEAHVYYFLTQNKHKGGNIV